MKPKVFFLLLLALGLGSLRATPTVSSDGIDLNLGARVEPVTASARFGEPGFFVWCGAPIKGDDGRYHLFYSRWPVAAKFKPGWALVSEIAYAVADSPFGPYHPVSVALPARGINPATGRKYWDADCTHNPNILRHSDGKYYLIYMGNYGDGKDYATHRNHQRIGVAVADRPEGPWTRFDRPIIDVSPAPAAFDSLVVTNPAATLRPDGSVLLLYKAVTQAPGKVMGGQVRYGAAVARHPAGPYTKVPGRIFESDQPEASKHWMLAEDPYIWFSKKYGSRYYAVARDVVGQFTGDIGSIALFQSEDGLHWKSAANPKVLPSAYLLADGSRSAAKLERPVVLLDRDEPVALFGGADGYQVKGRLSANIQIAFTRPAPPPHATTAALTSPSIHRVGPRR